MSEEGWEQIQKIFEQALKRKPEERPAYLNETCGDDADLRPEVESLLEHHQEARTGFLEQADPDATVRGSGQPDFSDPLIDKRVGGFRIKRLITSGGMDKGIVCVMAKGYSGPRRIWHPL